MLVFIAHVVEEVIEPQVVGEAEFSQRGWSKSILGGRVRKKAAIPPPMRRMTAAATRSGSFDFLG